MAAAEGTGGHDRGHEIRAGEYRGTGRPRRPLARLAELTRPAAQANVPGTWWRLGYTTRFWMLLAAISLLAGMAGAGLRLLLRAVEHAAWD